MAKKRLITLISLGIIVIGSLLVFAICGYHLWLQEGIQGLASQEVLGVKLNQKNLANLSVFILMPFGFSGMLMAVYHYSVETAIKILDSSALLISAVGGALNYFFMLIISFRLF
ncbi:MAG: hypothetical protein A2Z91_03035 [Deltaproteobacteria bacterium GWA2_38_16]|nr:MAG: hypothetical protein A2Z91_03035 [Deltaproteobacteria bacterium GWA2_38_16]OGQ02862.1 MAG: hypothetical protein A3D19_06460 [Deltaproteobacteria bacterium RIFCSPHIGHO2_02_FULL_38_15]OGQ35119.1 MAG: hypothetical protein A3A72_03725 [Deltaproteobacteria bacterium RIFCSPLOWO2_01_FULL_38_9]OGQ61680.1 MAG: hypothetical protein A3G92_05735 [Deltaproteobacteria bacterium RIFCSPLOWO2_12_FULL_38_8]HBQ21707.1 hypothetical protein [Deltaproteobacteria bacterium]